MFYEVARTWPDEEMPAPGPEDRPWQPFALAYPSPDSAKPVLYWRRLTSREQGAEVKS